MKNSRKVFGWVALSIAAIAFIAQTVLEKSGITYPGISFFGVIEGGLLLLAAALLMNAQKNEQAMKQLKTELRDERNTLIQGKAATATLFPVLCLLGILSTYLLSKDMAVPGYLVLGIDLFGGVLYAVSLCVIGRKM